MDTTFHCSKYYPMLCIMPEKQTALNK